MPGLFRCAGDILFSDHPPIPGQITDVQLKQFSETSNFLQCLHPLTKERPYFFAQIRALSNNSKIIIGIAGPEIAEDAIPGQWINTVGYCSQTGRCTTSHSYSANTYGEKFGIGDVFGVFVNHFGKQMSTVTFVKNGQPVATRYHFETDHGRFLPTITLENGPIDLGVMWPQAALGKPFFSDKNMIHWIRSSDIQYDMSSNMFIKDKKENGRIDSVLQSPSPLGREFQHYEVVVHEVSSSGAGPFVGLATCSPLKPTPVCEILRDYFRWMADGVTNKIRVGQKIGMGIHYDPSVRENVDFCELNQQIVLCFVTLDSSIAVVRMMIQPEGGFFPLVLLKEYCRKVVVDVETNRKIEVYKDLDAMYHDKMEEVHQVLRQNSLKQCLSCELFRRSSSLTINFHEHFQKEIVMPDHSKQYFRVGLMKKDMGIHLIQFRQPLTKENPFFCIEIRKLYEDSVLTIGIADSSYPENKHPGKLKNSVGYTSKDGKMYYDGRSDGNTLGERFEEGDVVGVELVNMDSKFPVLLFSKNCRPIGTRFLSINDPKEFLPSVSLCGNGYDVEIDIFWQNQYLRGPTFSQFQPQDWCLPKDSTVDEENRIIYINKHTDPLIIQCPHPLNPEEDFDYFEIELIDEFGKKSADGVRPPGVALTSACFQNISVTSSSTLRQDFIRFMAVNGAEDAVDVGSSIGWGLIIPESEKDKDDRLVVCYLTINKNVAITRVMYEPPGGFYPALILCQGANRVKLGTVMHIYSHPITEEYINRLLNDAREILVKEKEMTAQGKDPQDIEYDQNVIFKNLQQTMEEEKKKTGKMANVAMTAHIIHKRQQSVRSQKQSKSCVLL